MSRSATMEYIGCKRRAYLACKTTGQKSRLLDEVCQTTGLERKYASRLLTGNRRYRDHPGRGRTYTSTDEGLLVRVWEAEGCMSTKYLRACIGRALKDLGEEEHVDPGAAAAVMRMSASTMDRMLRGKPRVKPGLVRRNRRSGLNSPLAGEIPSVDGEAVPARLVPPGDDQLDTVAHGGGVREDNYFWSVCVSDRRTQWTEAAPAWNRGAEATTRALDAIRGRFPFPIRILHSDNGAEFINHHLVGYLRARAPGIVLQRSRPRHKNDNAHVEQKNGSVVRELLGETILDCLELEGEVWKLEEDWCVWCNLCRPCVMRTGSTKLPGRKGFSKTYDAPRTPAQRVLESGVLDAADAARLRARIDGTNGIALRRSVLRRLARIKRKLEAYHRGVSAGMLTGPRVPEARPFGPPPSGDASSTRGPVWEAWNLEANPVTGVQHLTKRSAR